MVSFIYWSELSARLATPLIKIRKSEPDPWTRKPAQNTFPLTVLMLVSLKHWNELANSIFIPAAHTVEEG